MKPKNRIKKHASAVAAEIKWDTKRQDDRAEEKRAKEIKLAAGRVYQDLKREFMMQRRTPAEVFDFPKKVMDAIAAIPGIDTIPDWKNYTINLLDDKAAEALALKMTIKNHITQILPPGASNQPPYEGDFTTPEEFIAIPFLQPFIKHEDFIGFVLDQNFLGALMKDESVTVIAKLLNTRGVEKLPTYAQMQAELTKLPDKPEEE